MQKETKYRITSVRIGTSLMLIAFSFLAATVQVGYATPYNMRYVLSYTGVPFAGGAIALASNFTNTGQLTIRVTSIAFTSDFWSNGTLGHPFNLTAGASKEINTPVAIPASVSTGSHVVTATAYWQYSNSSGWFNASPIVTSTTVPISQTIESLFASLATALVIGLVVAGGIIVLVVLVTVLKRRKSKPQPPSTTR